MIIGVINNVGATPQVGAFWSDARGKFALVSAHEIRAARAPAATGALA